MRHEAGTRTPPCPVSSNQYNWHSETVAGFANAYSIHPVRCDRFCVHQSKYMLLSLEEVGSSSAFTGVGFLRPSVVTLAFVVTSGGSDGFALASVLGIKTI